MNRHDRRRQQAQARREQHNQFYNNYIRHLPRIPWGAPLEPGTVCHVVCAHDDDCGIYAVPHGTLADCTCNPVVSRHVEPRRQ
jgi:hypothetical protein